MPSHEQVHFEIEGTSAIPEAFAQKWVSDAAVLGVRSTKDYWMFIFGSRERAVRFWVEATEHCPCTLYEVRTTISRIPVITNDSR